MSKKLTQKGLALGVAVAFASTAFAGSPASAEVGAVSLDATVGDSYTTLLGSTFRLDSIITTGTQDAANLRYKITGVAAEDLLAEFNQTSSNSFNAGFVTSDEYDYESVWDYNAGVDNEGVNDNDLDGAEATDTTFVVTPGFDYYDAADNAETEDDYDGYLSFADTGVLNQLEVSLDSDVTATKAITVQAWVDSVQNNKIDAGEVKSATQTITFKKASEVKPVLKFQEPVIEEYDLYTEVTASGLNLEMLSGYGEIEVGYFFNGSDSLLDTTANDRVLATYDSDLKALVADGTASNSLDAGSYKAQAYFDGSVWGDKTSSVRISNGSNDDVDYAYLVRPDSSSNIYTESWSDSDRDGDIGIRSGVKSLNLIAQIADDADDDLEAAGVYVRAVIDSINLDATTKVTIGGKTFTDDDSEVVVVLGKTNSAGQVPFAIQSNTGLDDDDFEIELQALTSGSGWDSYDGYTYELDWEEAYIWSVCEDTFTCSWDSSVDDEVIGVQPDSSYTTSWTIYDQFGSVWNRKTRLWVDNTSSVNYFGRYVTTSNGKFTVSDDVTDDEESFDIDVTADEVWDSVDEEWDEVDVDGYAYVVVAETGKATEITADASDETPALSSDDFVKFNTNFSDNDLDEPTVSAYLSGEVLDADGEAIPGAIVKLSAKGIQFVNEDEELYSIDSITVRADASGFYKVYYLSHTAGDVVITATSGAAKATSTITFDAPTVATTITAQAKGAVASGSVVNVVLFASDKWGNAVDAAQGVDISLTSEGVGFLSSESVTTNSNGKASAKLIIGASEKGTTEITASSGDLDDAVIKVASGVKATVVSKPAKGATVSVVNAKGSTIKVVRGTKSVTKTATAKTQKVTLKKGTGAVKIYVNGTLVLKK